MEVAYEQGKREDFYSYSRDCHGIYLAYDDNRCGRFAYSDGEGH